MKGFKRTRLKVTIAVIFADIACAVAKNWFPGIDLAILTLATATGLGYLYAETKRSSKHGDIL